jgi:hypothetical protein
MSCSLTTSSVTPARAASSPGQHVDDQRAAADHVDPARVDGLCAAALGAGHAEQFLGARGAGLDARAGTGARVGS